MHKLVLKDYGVDGLGFSRTFGHNIHFRAVVSYLHRCFPFLSLGLSGEPLSLSACVRTQDTYIIRGEPL